MSLRKIIKLFDKGCVMVVGERGSGKDVLFGNVIARRKEPYVSNLDYGGDREELNLSKLDMGCNSYVNFLEDNFNQVIYPYTKGADVYVSDANAYLPAQYCNELNKRYPYLPTYFQLSRQISRNSIHCNAQAYGRVWDKFREQAFRYVSCERCVFLGPLVWMQVIVYDKAESCAARVKPCRIKYPLICGGQRRTQIDLYLDNFYNQHGEVKLYNLFFINKSKHDTYAFEKKMRVRYLMEEKNEEYN